MDSPDGTFFSVPLYTIRASFVYEESIFNYMKKEELLNSQFLIKKGYYNWQSLVLQRPESNKYAASTATWCVFPLPKALLKNASFFLEIYRMKVLTL